jgi:ABC-type nitrate/sulfonate/bicarbonate transport system substrate-binding protein
MKRGAVLALMVGLLCAACFGTETVRVALDWTPNTNHTGLLVASRRGFFDDVGLDLRLLEPGPTVALQLVATGRADFGISSEDYVVMARAEGIPVVSIAALYPHNTSGFASPSDRAIRSPRDCAGKTYAGWGSEMEEVMIRTVMELDGADPSDVGLMSIGTIDFSAAVRLDVADFYWIFYGWEGVRAELEGIAFDYLPLRDLADVLDYYTPVLITSERMIRDHGDVVVRFLDATARGYTAAATDPDAAAEALLEYAPELDSTLVLASQRWLAGQSEVEPSTWGRQREDVWVEFAVWAWENGLIEREIDPLAAFTNALLPGAAEEDG